jgi:hypothetical protein
MQALMTDRRALQLSLVAVLIGAALAKGASADAPRSSLRASDRRVSPDTRGVRFNTMSSCLPACRLWMM